MKSLNDRRWSGDLEVVYERAKPYTAFLKNIFTIADTALSVGYIDESWLREENERINIKINYTSKGKTYTIWTERRGDLLNMDVLFLINKQLNLTDYKFEYSSKEETVYFINELEKKHLKEKGILLDKQDPVFLLDFILYNIVNDLETEENDFTYMMIEEVVQHIEEYYYNNWQKKEFKNFQYSIKEKVLNHIDWERLIEKGIYIDKLYEFANKSII